MAGLNKNSSRWVCVFEIVYLMLSGHNVYWCQQVNDIMYLKVFL